MFAGSEPPSTCRTKLNDPQISVKRKVNEPHFALDDDTSVTGMTYNLFRARREFGILSDAHRALVFGVDSGVIVKQGLCPIGPHRHRTHRELCVDE